MYREAEIHSAADVAKNPLDGGPVGITRGVHVEAYLLDGILQLRACKRQMLHATDDGAVVRRIRGRRAIAGGELGLHVDRSARGAHEHTSADEGRTRPRDVPPRTRGSSAVVLSP